MREREKDIVTVGGGTGSPIVNRALLLAGVPHINAIAAMYDNGGYTGKRRLLDETGKEVAYSDALRIMCSLIDPNNRNQTVMARCQDMGLLTTGSIPKKALKNCSEMLINWA